MFTSLYDLFTCLTKTEKCCILMQPKAGFLYKKAHMLSQNDTQNNDMLSVIMRSVAMLSDVLVITLCIITLSVIIMLSVVMLSCVNAEYCKYCYPILAKNVLRYRFQTHGHLAMGRFKS